MSETIKINLEDANAKQLTYYATTILNLDIASRGVNNNALRAKIIQAHPGIEQIEVPAHIGQEQPKAKRETPMAAGAPASSPARPVAPNNGGNKSTHFSNDPIVEVTILPSADDTRPKDVQLACQGDVFILKRGERVKIPYRFFISSLVDAVESVFRDTDEINPATGLPIKQMVEQPSYPFMPHKLPSDEEIAEWHERIKDLRLG